MKPGYYQRRPVTDKDGPVLYHLDEADNWDYFSASKLHPEGCWMPTYNPNSWFTPKNLSLRSWPQAQRLMERIRAAKVYGGI